MTLYLPSLLQRNRTLNVVEKFHEQALFRYLEDDRVGHHADLSTFYARDKRQVRFHQSLLGRQRYPFPLGVDNKNLQ